MSKGIENYVKVVMPKTVPVDECAWRVGLCICVFILGAFEHRAQEDPEGH